MHAGSTTAAATGVNGRRLIPVNTQDGPEFTLPGGHTLTAGLAALIINAGRDDRVQAIDDAHTPVHSS